MASIVTNLLSGGIEGAGKGIASVINAIKGKSPEDAAKLAQITADLETMHTKYESDFALATISENIALNQTAAANIQADSKAGWVQSLARPSVIWMGNLLLIWNYVCRPMFLRWQLKPVELPDMFWYVWCACVLGYVVSRTGQDIIGKVVGGAGGSIQLPGFKADSKGD
jgi:hypothetical protein